MRSPGPLSVSLRSFSFFPLLLFSACSSYDDHAGRFYEAIGRPIEASISYEKFLERSPRGHRAAEINVRLADIEATAFHRCIEADRHYEAAARNFPKDQKWRKRAEIGLMSCPDFSPLSPGYSWIYGDSATLGKNMRLARRTSKSGNAADNELLGILYAGTKKIRNQKTRYLKSDWAIFSMDGAEKIPLLRYPFTRGRTWSFGSGAKRKIYFIASNSATVKTAAGTFKNCLKVRESYARFPGSWTYSYYAPWVGWIKTTTAGPGFEAPDTELLRYSPAAPN